ncbi:MAG TPA: FAD-dependent oxidoreductase [Polyangiaceae bacterium]|nr:FAD-dependent oxidoreductase [Polyangiaceae bacterium]
MNGPLDEVKEDNGPVSTVFSGLDVDCCIVGGGPCGMMAGLLLARAGVRVAVLEKHVDFLRDFRGDTVHPSTLEVMAELGMLDELLKRPHTELKELTGDFFGKRVKLADFSELGTTAPFVALMPQWDFLDFLARQAAKLPQFTLLMGSEARSLVFDQGRVVGVRAAHAQGVVEVRAKATVVADGRDSLMRKQAGLPLRSYHSAVDVLWFRLSRTPEDGDQALGHVSRGCVLVLLNRGEYWQCACVVEKGRAQYYEQEGIESLRAKLRPILPLPPERLEELDGWNRVKLLSVEVNRLRRWARPGMLCIGDAAHAMSPVGGIGINLAVQDAVAAARLLTPLLRAGRTPSLWQLKRVQRRRSFVTHLTVRLQLLIQNQFLSGRLHDTSARIPWPVALLNRSPWLRRAAARFIGLGLRREHVPASAAAG